MYKTQIESFLAYFSVSFAGLAALGGNFILGIAFITAGQRAPYAAGVTCWASAITLSFIAAALFRKVNAAQRLNATSSC